MADIWQAFDNYDRKTGFVIKTSNKPTYQDYERLNQEYLKLQSENERLCQIIDFHQRAFDVYYDEEDQCLVRRYVINVNQAIEEHRNEYEPQIIR